MSADCVSIVLAGYHHGQDGVDEAPQAILARIDLGSIRPTLLACAPTQAAPSPRAIKNIHRPFRVAEATRAVHEQVSRAPSHGLCIVLGGDHSISIGSIAAMAERHPSLSVVWFDAHADINRALRSESGKIHGCPVSFLLGHPDSVQLEPFGWFRALLAAFQQRHGQAGFVRPQNLGFVGLRSVDPPEAATLAKEGIATVYMDDVRTKGLQAAVDELLERIDPLHANPIHLSFDVDGMDPRFAPSTGTPVAGGLSLDDALYIVRRIKQTGRLVSVDIVEVNPLIGTALDVQTTLASTVQVVQALLE